MNAASKEPLLLLGMLLILTLGAAILLSQLAASRRRRELLAAIAASSRAQVKLLPARQGGMIACTLTPAPEPFAQFFVHFTMRPRPWPLGILSRIFGGRSQRIELRGVMRQRPRSEVVWRRGHAPERAAGRSPHTELWTLYPLPLLQGEYAVRGENAHALAHLFVETAARYGGFLQSCAVQADRSPHVQIALIANGLNAEDIPALVATVCALGRAAMR